MWNFPSPGIKAMSPALAGGLLTTGSLGKSRCCLFLNLLLILIFSTKVEMTIVAIFVFPCTFKFSVCHFVFNCHGINVQLSVSLFSYQFSSTNVYFVCVLSYFSRVQLCDSMDWSLPGSSVCRILQARILEWVAMSSSRWSSRPRDWTCVCCSGRWILYHFATWEYPTYIENLSNARA